VHVQQFFAFASDDFSFPTGQLPSLPPDRFEIVATILGVRVIGSLRRRIWLIGLLPELNHTFSGKNIAALEARYELAQTGRSGCDVMQ
jgi:hypothetical protein